MSTINDDLAALEAHDRVVELIKAVDPKVAKIQAKRDVQVARAKSPEYLESRMYKYGALVAIAAIMSVGGCSAYVFGPANAKQHELEERNKLVRYEKCLEKGGSYSARNGSCDLNP